MITPGNTWIQLMDGWDDASSASARVFMVQVYIEALRKE